MNLLCCSFFVESNYMPFYSNDVGPKSSSCLRISTSSLPCRCSQSSRSIFFAPYPPPSPFPSEDKAQASDGTFVHVASLPPTSFYVLGPASRRGREGAAAGGASQPQL